MGENEDTAVAAVPEADTGTEDVKDLTDPDIAAEETNLKSTRIRDYFRWRPLPWWLCFFLLFYLLIKFQWVYAESECAILGTPSPVSQNELKRAFRNISKCTHPDQLKRRLQSLVHRDPTPAEEVRSDLIYKRAVNAMESLQEKFKGKGRKKAETQRVACYEGEIEERLQEVLKLLAESMTEFGLTEIWEYVYGFVWSLITLEAGTVNTLFSVLWLLFLWRLLKQFLTYLWRLGGIRLVVGVSTSVVIGPIPTVVNVLLLPILRCYEFVDKARVVVKGKVDSISEVDGKDHGAPEKPELTSEMKAAAARTQALPKGLRQRKKQKETEEERAKHKEELLSGNVVGKVETAVETSASEDSPSKNVAKTIGEHMPEGMWNCLRWTNATPIKARREAAKHIQFDLLLILTKPIIPLLFLIAIGQVWNGIFSSLLIGHVLRKVPDMSYEAHHLLCVFFGSVHTLLGVTAGQVEKFAAGDGMKILQLKWEWDFKDHLAVLNMVLLGATMGASSSLGNEPSYSASFAAGIALRIALAQDSIKGLSLFQSAAAIAESKLAEAGISYVESEAVAAYSGGGIGDCAGGPFRMLFGDGDFFGFGGDKAALAARVLKCWLILLPALSTVQWFQRAYYAARTIRKGKQSKTTPFVQRSILAILGVMQCLLIFNVELNASNGALANFWIAMLFGCVGESLLSTFDVRGSFRSVLILVLFLLI